MWIDRYSSCVLYFCRFWCAVQFSYCCVVSTTGTQTDSGTRGTVQFQGKYYMSFENLLSQVQVRSLVNLSYLPTTKGRLYFHRCLSVRQGVCLFQPTRGVSGGRVSVWGGGSLSRMVSVGGGVSVYGGVPEWRPPGGYCSVRYASYWNAFLFLLFPATSVSHLLQRNKFNAAANPGFTRHGRQLQRGYQPIINDHKGR